MYNSSERRDVRAKEKQAKLADVQRHEITAYIMSTAPSRAWMYDRLARCGVFNTPFTGNDATTNFNCGMQSIGLELLADIVSSAPDSYIQMMREANGRSLADDARRRRDHPDDERGDSPADVGDDSAGDEVGPAGRGEGRKDGRASEYDIYSGFKGQDAT